MIKRDTNMNIIRIRILLAMLCLPCTQAGAADTAGVDTSGWECEYCLVEQGTSGEIEAGVGHVSDDSFKFGEYNGLEDDGAYLIGNTTTRYRDENGGYFDLRIRDLGLDTRYIGIEGGRQGSYSLFLNYDGIPHNISDSASTPYLGNGSDTLTLPAGWIPATTTGGMTGTGSGLDATLQDVELETLRKRLSVGASFIPASKWETAIKVRHERRDGQKRTAGDFFQSAQLVEPVDYVTDEVDVSVTYTTRKWQSRLAYYGSFFSNDDESLTWEKAYSGFPNVATGALALSPDNQFHQFLFSSGYQLSERTRISGDVALGRMEQDENLLPAATIANPDPLPRNTTKAKINTTTANLKIDSAVNKKLRLNAAIRYNDRDNKTPLDDFPTYVADFIGPTLRTNRPYSFTDQTAKLGGSYRFSKKTRLNAGYEYETRKRTNQEVDKTRENTFWGKLNVRARDNIDITLKAEHAERDASGYNPAPAENPLLRKYNLADRKRDSGGIHAGFTPHERVSIGLGFDISKDDYTESVLGLTESREYSVNADVAVMVSEDTSMHVFAGRQQIKSEQANSLTFSTPDWFAKNEDTIDSFGIGVKHQLIKDKLDVGVDYMLSRSTGEVSVDDGTPGADFPDLVADLDTVKLYADYRLKDNMTLRAAYWYEDYNSDAWYLDGVDPATISNVLSFGEDSPDYTVHAVMLSIRYKF
jgi:MtrB/PioB family decaheme-associated outer membrane protein